MATRAKVAQARMASKAEPEAAPAEPIRQPIREPVQPAQDNMHMVPGRAVALNRAGKPIQRTAAETGVDNFFIPPGVQPPGWSWEWKRETCYGEGDPMYTSQLYQVGWEPVRFEAYPGVFAPRFNEQGNETVGPIRRGGLVLMERAQVLTDEAFNDAKRKADERVGTSRRQYAAPVMEAAQRSPTAEYDLTAQRSSYIKTSVENVNPTPPDANRQRVD